MKKFIQNKLKNEKGMTLIELLAVIVIIAIIAAIAIPAIANIIENSRVGSAKSDALSAFAAAELYIAENTDAYVAASNTIPSGSLSAGGYLDDLGSFDGTGTEPSFAEDASGDLIISGLAVNGEVNITFAGATKQETAGLPNSTGDATGEVYPTGTTAITVVR